MNNVRFFDVLSGVDSRGFDHPAVRAYTGKTVRGRGIRGWFRR